MYVYRMICNRPPGAYFALQVDWVLVILSDPSLGPLIVAIASILQPLLGISFHIVLSASLFCFK